MDNERPSEYKSWNSRLEEPGALPGAGLTDKEAAWDKLYDRLKESQAPRRRRMIWFWAAAACLLLIAVPAALLIKDRYSGLHQGPPPIPVATGSGKDHTRPQDGLASQPVNDPARDSTHTRSAAPATTASSRQAVAASSRSTVLQNPTLTNQTPGQLTRRSSNPPAHPTPAHPTMTRPGLNKLLAHGIDTLNLVFARPDLSKPVTVTATTPVKKEQRVVHINELEPQQSTPATVKGPRQKPGGLRFGLAPQENFRPSTSYVEPETQSILSLKHTQNP